MAIKKLARIINYLGNKNGKRKNNYFFIENFLYIILALFLTLMITNFCIEAVYVDGNSMLPTLKHNDKLIVEKIYYKFKRPERQQIIVFKYSADTRKRFVKRIIGVEGDRIKIINGKIYLNDKVLNEFYILESYSDDFEEVTVPKDTVFVLGDNRNNSKDSRFQDVGFVKNKLIVGRIIFKIYPFEAVREVK
jgi:signal peptidase I